MWQLSDLCCRYTKNSEKYLLLSQTEEAIELDLNRGMSR